MTDSAATERRVLLDVMADGTQLSVPIGDFLYDENTDAEAIARQISQGYRDLSPVLTDFDLLSTLDLFIQVQMPDGNYTRATLKFNLEVTDVS